MRKQKKYHYIYKTVNVLSGKYYIGMHSTNDLGDGYLGSGTRLRYSINKHGKDNHKLEILEFVNTRKELKSREKEIVTLNEIAKIDCMNLVVGGQGGFISLEGAKKGGKAAGKIVKERLKTDEEYRKKMAEISSNNFKKAHKSGKMIHNVLNNGFKGKSHSEETKQKMRKSKNVGSNNSQFGKCWITNEKENKKIFKGGTIPEGWRLGRKIK